MDDLMMIYNKYISGTKAKPPMVGGVQVGSGCRIQSLSWWHIGLTFCTILQNFWKLCTFLFSLDSPFFSRYQVNFFLCDLKLKPQHEKQNQKCLGPGLSSQALLFSFLFFLRFYSNFLWSWIRKLSSSTKIAKKDAWGKSKNIGKNNGFSGLSWPRTFFRGVIFWFYPNFFWLLGPEVSIGY